ncbi:MAG: hypothetical protein J7K12_01255, partial [Thermoplasmata archaeon]|nr:hypothetical protein [Thermoplasmata archaeon]
MKGKKVVALGKIMVVIVSLLFSSIVFSAKSETASKDEISISVSFDNPIFKKVNIGNKTYDKIEIPNLHCVGNPGEPYLPSKAIRVLLPYGKKVDIIIWNGKEISIGSGYKIVPAGKEIPMGVKEYSPPKPNEEIYSSYDPFPANVYKNLGVQFFRGYAILVIDVFPLRYIPARGELIFYPHINFTIYLKDGLYNPLYRGLAEDEQEVAKKVLNPGTLSTYPSKSTASSYPGGICDSSKSYKFVIITNEELNNTAGPYNWDALISWKQSNGISATKVTVERIVACPDYWNTTNPLFNDTQALIREFIRDAYLDWGTEYVLLGGDADGADVGGESGDNIVPVRYLYAGSYDGDQGDQIPSDLYYACLDGNFNYDEDGYWGEANDGTGGGVIDYKAEVYVGRAPVDSAIELSNFVRKTIEYGNSNDAYLQKVLLVGEQLDSTPTWGGDYKDEIINESDANGYHTTGIPSDVYTIDTLYDRTYSWSKSDLIAKINHNTHLINHMGHSSVGYNMKLWYTDVDNYFNNTGYFFLYSQGCYPGSFDNWHYKTDYGPGYYTDYDCIGEHYIGSSYGAFACVLNSRYGWYEPGGTNGASQRFDREFWDAIFGEGIREIGRANQDSKEDILDLFYYDINHWCAYELNLFGDPSLEIKLPTRSVVYVDDDYNSNTPGWQYDHFSSIQPAINAVEENGTVNVYSGTYYENIVI